AGMLGNWINAWVQRPAHLSIGASTAVFAAVGLLAGSEARARYLLREPSARRFAPVGTAFLLLLYLGVGKHYDVGDPTPAPDVDVLAHVFGLLAGLALGPALAAVPRARIGRRGFQLACAFTAGGVLAACWLVALARNAPG